MDDLRINDAPHVGKGVEQRVAIARSGQSPVEDRDDAPVLTAADQSSSALRENERGSRKVDVPEAVPAASLGRFTSRLGERIVGARRTAAGR